VDAFLTGKEITAKNRANIVNCINSVKDAKLKKELRSKIDGQKGVANSDHHRKQLDY